MTDNQAHRDQIAAVLRENMSRGTSGRWIATYGITPEDFADALLASDALAQIVRDAKAEAWDEGDEAGYETAVFYERGLSTDPDAHEFPRRNPYRAALDEPTGEA